MRDVKQETSTGSQEERIAALEQKTAKLRSAIVILAEFIGPSVQGSLRSAGVYPLEAEKDEI